MNVRASERARERTQSFFVLSLSPPPPCISCMPSFPSIVMSLRLQHFNFVSSQIDATLGNLPHQIAQEEVGKRRLDSRGELERKKWPNECHSTGFERVKSKKKVIRDYVINAIQRCLIENY